MIHFHSLSLTSKNEIDTDASIFKRFCEFFSLMKTDDDRLSFLPKGITTVSISEFRRLSSRKIGNSSYSFLLSYKYKKDLQQKYLVLKIYCVSLDPVLKKYVYNENFKRCLKEFQVLKGLESVDFPCPKAFLCETDSKVIGNPFMIMQREEIYPKGIFNINSFAENLATLHSLDIDKLGISTLRVPVDKYQFARDCIIYLKLYLNLYPKHGKELMKDFEFAIHWLETNFFKNSCSKYSLLHGDYRARFNTILTKDGRMLVTDWEDALIGDSMYDVGLAYVRAQVDFGKKTADRFLQEYKKHFNEDISERIDFYKLIAHLRLAITHSSVLNAPLRTYEIRGSKALFLFPFLSLPFVSKNTGTDLDVVWIENFKEFIEENLRHKVC